MGLILREGTEARCPGRGRAREAWVGLEGWHGTEALCPAPEPSAVCVWTLGRLPQAGRQGRNTGPRGRDPLLALTPPRAPLAPPTPTAGNPQRRPTKQTLWFVAPQRMGQPRCLPLPQGEWGRGWRSGEARTGRPPHPTRWAWAPCGAHPQPQGSVYTRLCHGLGQRVLAAGTIELRALPPPPLFLRPTWCLKGVASPQQAHPPSLLLQEE